MATFNPAAKNFTNNLKAAKTGTNMPGSYNASRYLYKPAAKPAPKSSGGGGGGGVGGGGGGNTTNRNVASSRAAGPTIDQNAIRQFDQAIGWNNAALGRLGTTLNSGYSSIESSWQNALNQLLAGRNQTEADTNTSRKGIADQYITAKNTIGANAGNSLNGLQRLLGSRGAGGGSTARIAAPGAVAREATIRRGAAAGTNAENNRAIDASWSKYLIGYNNEVNSANTQRNNSRAALERSIEGERANLLKTLAGLQGQRASAAGGNAVGSSQPYLDQANAALNRAATYSVAPISYNTVGYTAPSLDKYLVAPNSTPTVQGQAPGNDYSSPYYGALMGQKDKEKGGAIA